MITLPARYLNAHACALKAAAIAEMKHAEAVAERFGLSVHDIFLGEDFLDLLVDPPHGYGSQMNICIDCRILMFKKAKDLADKVGAEYLITGEVLNVNGGSVLCA